MYRCSHCRKTLKTTKPHVAVGAKQERKHYCNMICFNADNAQLSLPLDEPPRTLKPPSEGNEPERSECDF